LKKIIISQFKKGPQNEVLWQTLKEIKNKKIEGVV
jgi:hypothetical protein